MVAGVGDADEIPYWRSRDVRLTSTTRGRKALQFGTGGAAPQVWSGRTEPFGRNFVMLQRNMYHEVYHCPGVAGPSGTPHAYHSTRRLPEFARPGGQFVTAMGQGPGCRPNSVTRHGLARPCYCETVAFGSTERAPSAGWYMAGSSPAMTRKAGNSQ
jgi:hypothetical protein